MVNKKTVFLDRDGTINEDYGYVYKIEDLKFKEGSIKGLKKLYNAGYQLIIVTNQSGIGRGYYNQNDYEKFTEYMLSELNKENIKITAVYYCPHKKEDNCNCRKPKIELFKQAIKEHNVDTNNSYAIGDKLRDIEISKYYNIEGILLEKSNSQLSFENLDLAANYIINKSKKNHQSQ